MELINVSMWAAGYSMATDPNGRQWIVLAAKASFEIPREPGAVPALLEEQVPLFMSDEYEGDPASSPMRYENDFALRKPRCDVLLNGSCHVPHGKRAARLAVGIRVGALAKAFMVVGHRYWRNAAVRVAPSAIEPFSVMPISYANAYGGIDRPDAHESTHRWYDRNPVGLGFRPGTPGRQLAGERLPNTAALDRPIEDRNGDHAPMAFGVVGRSWAQRLRWAGTYDAAWRTTQYPFLPLDFDDRYFQSAPTDQQCDYLVGGEAVTLLNLTPEGRTEFVLPRMSEPFDIAYCNGERRRLFGVVDTLVLEPDLRRFTLTLRASFALKHNVKEVRAVEFGRVLQQAVPPEGEAPEHAAKRRASLARLVAERQAQRRAVGGEE